MLDRDHHASSLEGVTPRYRGTSVIRNAPPPRTMIWPYAQAYCRVLGGGVFL